METATETTTVPAPNPAAAERAGEHFEHQRRENHEQHERIGLYERALKALEEGPEAFAGVVWDAACDQASAHGPAWLRSEIDKIETEYQKALRERKEALDELAETREQLKLALARLEQLADAEVALNAVQEAGIDLSKLADRPKALAECLDGITRLGMRLAMGDENGTRKHIHETVERYIALCPDAEE